MSRLASARIAQRCCLGMSVLNRIGPFRLDAANLTLTFG